MNMMTMFVMVALGLTVLSLFDGIVSMARGGEADARQSHWFMFRRIGFQALAVMFILLGLLSQLG